MIWRSFLSLLLATVARKLTVFVLPVGGSDCYRILCQKLSLDRRTHLRLQSCGLGRHTAAVSISTNTYCASLIHPEYQTIKWSFSSVAVRDSADRVVGENGTYEELIACSHEIAASTAQLVAASKVQTSEYSPVVKSCNHVVLLYENCLFLCSTNMEKMTLRPRVRGWNTQLFAPINGIYLIAELLFRFA